MKFTLLTGALLSAAALTDALSIDRNRFTAYNQNILEDSLKVPGESPLNHCAAGYEETDLVTISRVDLSPNPPLPGKKLDITATGTVHKRIEDGAYIKIVVKYGLIRLLSTTLDLCEHLNEVDMECPVEPGDLSLTKSVDLPSQIPPGKYNVVADVYSADDEPITCLTADVKFNLPEL